MVCCGVLLPPCHGRDADGAVESRGEIGQRREAAAPGDGFEGSRGVGEQFAGSVHAAVGKGAVQGGAGGAAEPLFEGASAQRKRFHQFLDPERSPVRCRDETECLSHEGVATVTGFRTETAVNADGRYASGWFGRPMTREDTVQQAGRFEANPPMVRGHGREGDRSEFAEAFRFRARDDQSDVIGNAESGGGECLCEGNGRGGPVEEDTAGSGQRSDGMRHEPCR